MPKGEIEYHPYLEEGFIKGANKLILGSFPVYECTNPENDLKESNRKNEGTIRFFYGSNRNSLWNYYQKFVDKNLSPSLNKTEILKSLNSKQIAISDIIKSCERWKEKEGNIDQYSSEDQALKNRVYNTNQVQDYLKSDISKILCTSKGVMKLLEQKIIAPIKDPIGSRLVSLSNNFQDIFLKQIGGSGENVSNPVVNVYDIQGRKITILALPSPGSPQRKIAHFGYLNGKKMDYVELYFEKAFEWFARVEK